MGGPVRLKDLLELRVPVGISFKVRRLAPVNGVPRW